ncbi:MAG: hypothetical protein KKD29_06335 [Candidatus Omnitrophica bacterium]|nr:hypothetical protein [Candidatus Omnitrophota bacterium]MBU4487724.1 hypothetical protein [Candidatus Omnitrophota bacterium]MCG2705264.1 hypothetical protein [Candidatus Omnitrophota bacterium]
MSSKAKFFVVLLVSVLAISFSMVTKAEAGSPFADAVMKMFGYGAKTTEKTVNAVGTGVKKTGDMVGQEAKDLGDVVTGKGSKVKDVIVNPVTKSTEAVGGTAYGVVNAPIEAGKEVYGTKEACETK